MKRYLWLLCLLTACREAPQGFVAPDPFDSLGADAGRLTWNVRLDHSPTWNGTSDSVYYSAGSYPGFTETGGLLLRVPRGSGRAQLLLESLQRAVDPQPWFAAPALSPNRQSLAFVELTDIYDPNEDCNAGLICPMPPPTSPQPDTTASLAPLIAGVIRVRPVNGGNEVRLPIQFSTRSNDRVSHPFQRQFQRDGAEIFRPSWSPDGTRLVYSNGLQLFIWTVGTSTPVAIPNTEDGVWPAWSPNGQTIAFTKLLRLGSRTTTCGCFRIGRQLPIYEVNKTIVNDGGSRIGELMTISPDGTGLRNLGVGDAPAWSPDGQTLVFARGGQLVRTTADGNNATPIANTDNAFEPAVSPNGEWLTFSRNRGLDDRVDYDVWVVNF